MPIKPQLHTPDTIAAARDLLAQDGTAVLIAGGQWLTPQLRSGTQTPEHIISLHRVKELHGIRQKENRIEIGAAETHHAISQSQLVQSALPGLAQIAAQIGDPATRQRGTIGGGLCAAPGQCDYSLALLGLDAQITTTHRSLTAVEFLDPSNPATMDQDEILISISLFTSPRTLFAKIPHPAANSAAVGVFAAELSGDRCRLAIMGDGVWPQRLTDIESRMGAWPFSTVFDWPAALERENPFFVSRLDALWRRGQKDLTPD
ncbi:MAG: FAD binding domain-containing protein [Henriciella sp.]